MPHLLDSIDINYLNFCKEYCLPLLLIHLIIIFISIFYTLDHNLILLPYFVTQTVLALVLGGLSVDFYDSLTDSSCVSSVPLLESVILQGALVSFVGG